MSLRSLFYALPPEGRYLARRLYYLPVDFWEKLTGKRSPLTPPRGLEFTGGGGFEKVGKLSLELFIRYGKLQPHHRVLDVGSGLGRMAVPLTTFLNEHGSYEGFDIVRKGVEWCTNTITSRFPNFRFRWIDLNNDLYRSTGADAASFVFPYPDNEFDFVFLTSVFTHLEPAEVENYLAQIERVLKPGAHCFATFFLFTEASKAQETNPAFRFLHDHQTHRYMDEAVKAANVAYQEEFLEQILRRLNVRIIHKQYGFWRSGDRGNDELAHFQDILVFQKL